MPTLTARQAEILRLIQDSLADTGMPPTRQEIASAFGFQSANAAEGHLKALARKGLIELLPGSSRGIRLLKSSGMPVVGHVAAGHPVLAEERIDTHYHIDPALFTPRADYLLRVHGMSMRDAGILDGDLLAIHRTPQAQDGQIVVARLHDEVTVKRLYRRGGKVVLQPENPDFAVIAIDPARQQLVIEGICVGVIRNSPWL